LFEYASIDDITLLGPSFHHS